MGSACSCCSQQHVAKPPPPPPPAAFVPPPSPVALPPPPVPNRPPLPPRPLSSSSMPPPRSPPKFEVQTTEDLEFLDYIKPTSPLREIVVDAPCHSTPVEPIEACDKTTQTDIIFVPSVLTRIHQKALQINEQKFRDEIESEYRLIDVELRHSVALSLSEIWKETLCAQQTARIVFTNKCFVDLNNAWYEEFKSRESLYISIESIERQEIHRESTTIAFALEKVRDHQLYGERQYVLANSCLRVERDESATRHLILTQAREAYVSDVEWLEHSLRIEIGYMWADRLIDFSDRQKDLLEIQRKKLISRHQYQLDLIASHERARVKLSTQMIHERLIHEQYLIREHKKLLEETSMRLSELNEWFQRNNARNISHLNSSRADTITLNDVFAMASIISSKKSSVFQTKRREEAASHVRALEARNAIDYDVRDPSSTTGSGRKAMAPLKSTSSGPASNNRNKKQLTPEEVFMGHLEMLRCDREKGLEEASHAKQLRCMKSESLSRDDIQREERGEWSKIESAPLRIPRSIFSSTVSLPKKALPPASFETSREPILNSSSESKLGILKNLNEMEESEKRDKIQREEQGAREELESLFVSSEEVTRAHDRRRKAMRARLVDHNDLAARVIQAVGRGFDVRLQVNAWRNCVELQLTVDQERMQRKYIRMKEDIEWHDELQQHEGLLSITDPTFRVSYTLDYVEESVRGKHYEEEAIAFGRIIEHKIMHMNAINERLKPFHHRQAAALRIQRTYRGYVSRKKFDTVVDFLRLRLWKNKLYSILSRLEGPVESLSRNMIIAEWDDGVRDIKRVCLTWTESRRNAATKIQARWRAWYYRKRFLEAIMKSLKEKIQRVTKK